MSAKRPVFVIGPGFLGRNVLELLLSEGHPVTTLVRRQSQAKQIEASGAKVVLGDLDDSALIEKLTAEHTITIHTAGSDHLPSVQAVLSGLRQRATEGKHSVYIHTSGSNITDDGAAGAFKGHAIYHDSNRAEIDAISAEAPHRDVDIPITQAQNEPELAKFAKIAIVVPPTIFGINPQHKRVSYQWPYLVRFALKQGYAGYVGEGLSVENQIHVLDIARAYPVLLHHLEIAPANEFIANPFFFCENGVETSWKEVSTEIGKILYEKGVISSATPRTIPPELYGDLFGDVTPVMVGLNSRTRGERLRKLGWETKEKGWKESLAEDEIPVILAE